MVLLTPPLYLGVKGCCHSHGVRVGGQDCTYKKHVFCALSVSFEELCIRPTRSLSLSVHEMLGKGPSYLLSDVLHLPEPSARFLLALYGGKSLASCVLESIQLQLVHVLCKAM